MTVEALTEQLVSQLGLSKALFVELVKDIEKEPDTHKWDYGDIGNRINLKLDEKITLEKTKKQREEHTAAAYERHVHESYAISTNAARRWHEREQSTNKFMKADPNKIQKPVISKRDVREF